MIPSPFVAILLPGLFLGADLTPEEFADRWVETTLRGSSAGVEALLDPAANCHIESRGRHREMEPSVYGAILPEALQEMRGLQRRRGPVERVEREGKGTRISFTVVDRFEAGDSFSLESETREEFDFPSGEIGRASRYLSVQGNLEVLHKPEAWRNYGGPPGINGFLLEAHFHSIPPWTGLAAVAGLIAIIVVVKILHSSGIPIRPGGGVRSKR